MNYILMRNKTEWSTLYSMWSVGPNILQIFQVLYVYID